MTLESIMNFRYSQRVCLNPDVVKGCHSRIGRVKSVESKKRSVMGKQTDVRTGFIVVEWSKNEFEFIHYSKLRITEDIIIKKIAI